MANKLTIKERLRKKTCKELSAIYVRMHGVDLLRGTKTERIIVLASSLRSRKTWDIIVGNNERYI